MHAVKRMGFIGLASGGKDARRVVSTIRLLTPVTGVIVGITPTVKAATGGCDGQDCYTDGCAPYGGVCPCDLTGGACGSCGDDGGCDDDSCCGDGFNCF